MWHRNWAQEEVVDKEPVIQRLAEDSHAQKKPAVDALRWRETDSCQAKERGLRSYGKHRQTKAYVEPSQARLRVPCQANWRFVFYFYGKPVLWSECLHLPKLTYWDFHLNNEIRMWGISGIRVMRLASSWIGLKTSDRQTFHPFGYVRLQWKKQLWGNEPLADIYSTHMLIWTS